MMQRRTSPRHLASSFLMSMMVMILFSFSGNRFIDAFSSSSIKTKIRTALSSQKANTEASRDTFNNTSPALEESSNVMRMMTDEDIVDNLSFQMGDFITNIDEIEDLPSLNLQDDEEIQEDPILKQLEETLLTTIEVLEDTLQETQIMNQLETMELREQNELLQKDLKEQKLISSQAIAQLQVERIVLEQNTNNDDNNTAVTSSSSKPTIPPKSHYESWSPAMVTMILQAQQEQHTSQLKGINLALEREEKERKVAEAKLQQQMKEVAAAAMADESSSNNNDELLQATIQKQQELLDVATLKIEKLDQDLAATKIGLDAQKVLTKKQENSAATREQELKGELTRLEKDKKNANAANTKSQSALELLRSSQDQLQAALEKAQGENKETKQSMAAANQELARTKRSLAESMAQVSRLDTRLAKIQKQQQQKMDYEKQQQQKLKEKQLLEKRAREEKLEQQRLQQRLQQDEEKRKAVAAAAQKNAYQSSPAKKSTTQTPRLDFWELTSAGEVQGSVFNHPSLPNGEPVRTSMLVNPRLAKDGATVKTRSGSMYRLGKPKPSPVADTKPDTAFQPKRGIKIFGGVKPSPYKQQKREKSPKEEEKQIVANENATPSPSITNITSIFGNVMGKINAAEEKVEETQKTSTPPIQPSIPSINLFGSLSKTGTDKTQEEKANPEEATEASERVKTSPSPNDFFGYSIAKSKKEKVKEEEQEEETTSPTPKIQPLSLNIFGSAQKTEKKVASKTETDKTQEEKMKPEETTVASETIKASPELDLTGTSIMNGKYLIAGKSKRSVTGRCLIMGAYRANNDNKPIGKPVIIKLSENDKAMRKEHSIYKKVTSGVNRGVIVKCHEYVSEVEDRPGKSALILERGVRDLKEHRKWKSFHADELKQALYSVNQCMESMHSARLVWTDLKTENFVVIEDEKGGHQVKAIDLESAMNIKDNPIDYTPEATPPEFAKEFVSGDPRKFVLDFSFDVWSFGMLAYEVSTGVGYFDGNSADAIMQKLSRNDIPNTSIGIEDDNLADLISQCLSVDPRKRPTTQKISRHPYFSSVAKSNIFSLW